MKFKTIIVNNLTRLKVNKMHLKLVTFTANTCTIGKLYIDDELICSTIEKPWRNNRPSVSCIPAGNYELKPCLSPKFGETYYLSNPELDVSHSGNTKRTHILIHKANKESQLLGCIAPVSYFGILDNEWAGLSSGKAYNKLMDLLNKEQHTIEIIRN